MTDVHQSLASQMADGVVEAFKKSDKITIGKVEEGNIQLFIETSKGKYNGDPDAPDDDFSLKFRVKEHMMWFNIPEYQDLGIDLQEPGSQEILIDLCTQVLKMVWEYTAKVCPIQEKREAAVEIVEILDNLQEKIQNG